MSGKLRAVLPAGAGSTGERTTSRHQRTQAATLVFISDNPHHNRASMGTIANQGHHILIVDDNPDQLRLLVQALHGTSYRVSVALHGDQGYARAAILLPDLILLDVCMPGRNGITIARLLKANPETQHIPIIFLSARAGADDKLTGLKSGAVDYIAKPFLIEEVIERVRIHLSLSPKNESNAMDMRGAQATANHPQPANLTLRQVATEFIFDHIHEASLKVSDAASALGISVQRLNTVFESSHGMSTFEFIRCERMRRAALMLGQGALPIAEIAVESGYANPANFSTEFRKFWGRTPTELRNEAQADTEALQRLISSRLSQIQKHPR